jgi:tetratricopeptide (TPR) repeat protein
MRPAIWLAFIAAASLHAEDAQPAAGKAPVTPDSMHGSASGTEGAKADAGPLHPSRGSTPSTANFPSQYLLFVAEAMKSFQARDFEGAIAYADRADALLPPTVWTINVRGAVAIERLQFADGEKFCMEALKLDPSFFPAKFNLAEIPFLQGKYPEARKRWETLYDRIAHDDPTGELLIYRIFLTFLLERDMAAARSWLDKLPFPSQTPAYQYAHAAWERQNGDIKKWQEWIDSAEFIWPLSKRSSFSDVLLQLKWLQKDAALAK